MKYKMLLSVLLLNLGLMGCAQNTSIQLPEKSVAIPVKVEDKLYFKVSVIQEIFTDSKDEKLNNDLSSYSGYVDLNKEGVALDKNQYEIYAKKISHPYVASKIFDENGKKEELRTEVLTGLSFNIMIDKTGANDEIEDKYLIFKLSEIMDWKKINTKNLYGMEEFIVVPSSMNLEEMILIPVKSFEMSRFFDNSKGRVVVKIVLSNRPEILK